uniref:MATH domain-containing protein n=1 Tax=Ascaris lumbricoides TaxID=6252 RepID=A0A9J2PLX1_ASCLU
MTLPVTIRYDLRDIITFAKGTSVRSSEWAVVNGIPFRIYCEPINERQHDWLSGYLGVYLDCFCDSKAASTSVEVKYTLRVVSQNGGEDIVKGPKIDKFDVEFPAKGSSHIVNFSQLLQPNSGFVCNNAVRIEIDVEPLKVLWIC